VRKETLQRECAVHRGRKTGSGQNGTGTASQGTLADIYRMNASSVDNNNSKWGGWKTRGEQTSGMRKGKRGKTTGQKSSNTTAICSDRRAIPRYRQMIYGNSGRESKGISQVLRNKKRQHKYIHSRDGFK